MPLREIIKSKLSATNIAFEEVSGSEWIKVKCMNPAHDDKHPSAGINTTTGIHYCFSCQHKFMFIKQDEDSSINDADIIWATKYANMKKSLQNEYRDYDSIHETILDRNKELFEPPIDHYITEEWRGLSADLLNDCGTYYCSRGKYSGRYIFPVYENSIFRGFDGRIVDASAQMIGAKWIRPRGMAVKDIIYPKDVLVKRFENLSHVIICEGVADALSYIQMGVPAIASFGLTPPSSNRIEDLIRLGVTKITIAFDNDAAGVAGAVKVIPIYAEWFDIVSHPMVNMIRNSGYKDANDFLVGIKTVGLKDKIYEDDCSDEH